MRLKNLANTFYEQRVPFVAYEFDTGDQSGCGVFRLDDTQVHYQRAAIVNGRSVWREVSVRKRLTPAKIRKHFRLIGKTCATPTWWLYTPGMNYAAEHAYKLAINEVIPEGQEGDINALLA